MSPDRGRASPPQQLILDLAGKPAFQTEDFLVAPPNMAAFDLIDLWPDWPASTLVLMGPPGCGKSHLGAIWARRTQATIIPHNGALDPDLSAPAFLLEDCDRAQRPDAALFHFLNIMREKSIWVVMTARAHPNIWAITTPDVLSRLRQSPAVSIAEPDMHLMRAVMIKLFADRQLRIDEDVVTFASRHLERSFGAVEAFVALVDEASLASGRRITRPLAANVLATMAGPQTA